jgi:hypothetical protein
MFSFPEFHENQDIIWDVYVYTSSSEDSRYDMIVGRDLMYFIGLDLRFSDSTMTWDNATHLKGHFFGVWSNSVVRGTEFLRFGLTIRPF